MPKIDDDLRELLLKTTRKAQQPLKISLQGPGPFELPLCDAEFFQAAGGTVVLELRPVGTEQTLRFPLTMAARRLTAHSAWRPLRRRNSSKKELARIFLFLLGRNLRLWRERLGRRAQRLPYPGA